MLGENDTRNTAREMAEYFHFTKAEHAISSISRLRLKVLKPSELNDPYDCSMEVIPQNWVEEEKCREIEDCLCRVRDTRFRLLCLSRRCDETLMWSHYADDHAGVALVLELRPSEELHPVSYRRERTYATLRMFQGEEKGYVKVVMESLLIKSLSWSYEDEHRLIYDTAGGSIVSEGPNDFVPILPTAISGVVLGHRCKTTAEEMYELFHHKGLRGARVWQIRKSVRTFSFERVPA